MSVDPVLVYLAQAPAKDVGWLAAAGLRVFAQMCAAEDWDGAADWLEAIQLEFMSARRELSHPLPDEEDVERWRQWLGPHCRAWFNTYDPTLVAPAPPSQSENRPGANSSDSSTPHERLLACLAQARTNLSLAQAELSAFRSPDGDVAEDDFARYDEARITWALTHADDLEKLLSCLAATGL